MSNFDREPKNPFCLCLFCGSIITIGLFSSLVFSTYSSSYVSLVGLFLRELWIFHFIFTLGFIMIIIGICLFIQKAQSEISEKRVICPNCKITLESLENIDTYQCPECKKKFKAKLNHGKYSSNSTPFKIILVKKKKRRIKKEN